MITKNDKLFQERVQLSKERTKTQDSLQDQQLKLAELQNAYEKSQFDFITERDELLALQEQDNFAIAHQSKIIDDLYLKNQQA